MPKKIKALGLCSGGLDSILSALLLKQQKIEIQWISFETPFFTAEKAHKAAAMINVPIMTQNITPIYIDLLKNPRCGFGKNMNPCMDCHALMFKLAGNLMRKKGFDFLFSGEVLAQRPMSQTRSSLNYVEKHSGFTGYILRPLSAKRLKETIPEKNNWVDRGQLLDLSGRSRKPQIALAKKYGISGYPAPAGGCLLTDKGYSKRLKDLIDHQVEFDENELHLLKYGRHLRLTDQTKIIVGRTQIENERIFNYFNQYKDMLLKTKNTPGPTVLIPNRTGKATSLLAAAICAGYSKARDNKPARVQIITRDDSDEVAVLPLALKEAQRYLIKG
jgi:tRNA U34 2-thiouridine synthase MnmA/TrmU